MAEPTERTGMGQGIGMSFEHRAVLCADRVLGDPERATAHVTMALRAAVTDYQRAFARRLVLGGVPHRLVWRIIHELPIGEKLPPGLVAPLAPELGG